MDNFSIFDKSQLAQAIEPFLPGGTDHVTPIAYRAWTPDIFLFLFRTTDPEGRDHFFAAVVYDHLANGRETAALILKRWQDLEVLNFLRPDESTHIEQGQDLGVDLDGVYRVHLAYVAAPASLGYWTNNIVITKDSDIDEELTESTTPWQDHGVWAVQP